jgi:hypothetical protein
MCHAEDYAGGFVDHFCEYDNTSHIIEFDIMKNVTSILPFERCEESDWKTIASTSFRQPMAEAG